MTLGEKAVIKELLALAGAIYFALEDSEEIAEGKHVIEAEHINSLMEVIDELENLPDDRPGYTMSYPAKAAWALRNLIEPEITKI